jgi:hypothetical protein
LAFGRLDRLRPGFGDAVAAARAHGFEPVLRAPGGHAVAYHEGCLGIDELLGEPDPIAGMHDRFAASGERLAAALRSIGVDARVGPVPREFCPGEFTVNARGAVKLVGTAQRVLRHASLLAASVAVSGADRLRAVLVDVYAALELDMDPATVGAVAAGFRVSGSTRSSGRCFRPTRSRRRRSGRRRFRSSHRLSRSTAFELRLGRVARGLAAPVCRLSGLFPLREQR